MTKIETICNSSLRPLLLPTEAVDETTVMINVLLHCFQKYWNLKQYPLKPENCLGNGIKVPFLFFFFFHSYIPYSTSWLIHSEYSGLFVAFFYSSWDGFNFCMLCLRRNLSFQLVWASLESHKWNLEWAWGWEWSYPVYYTAQRRPFLIPDLKRGTAPTYNIICSNVLVSLAI